MDRLVAELGGIETAIVTLQEQVCIYYFPHLHCTATQIFRHNPFNQPGHKRTQLWLASFFQ